MRFEIECVDNKKHMVFITEISSYIWWLIHFKEKSLGYGYKVCEQNQILFPVPHWYKDEKTAIYKGQVK